MLHCSRKHFENAYQKGCNQQNKKAIAKIPESEFCLLKLSIIPKKDFKKEM